MRGAGRRPLAGGGWQVAVEPERLERWFEGFVERHGDVAWTVDAESVIARAADGTVATCEVPFAPLPDGGATALARLVAHAAADRTVGVLLVRLGGYAAGVTQGGRWLASKVGTRPVHGRAAAGGWSQHRFARRREGQAREAVDAATEVAARILLPHRDGIAGLVTGGERRAVDAVLADARLAPLRPLVVAPFLDLPDPGQRVLEEAAALLRRVTVRVREPQT